MLDAPVSGGDAGAIAGTLSIMVGGDIDVVERCRPILEVMGRDSGWLAAASALSRRVEQDPPHIICTPEKPIEEDDFLSTVENSYNSYGFAVAVVAEVAE